MTESILVVGSVNMDLVVTVEKLPAEGETLTGKTICYIPGGKGANQAVAAARLGGSVAFVGKVGDDAFGNQLSQFLKEEHLDLSGLSKHKGSSGLAFITVGKNGNNTIVVLPGSNGEVSGEYVQKHKALLEKSAIIVAQYEIPLHSVESLFSLAKSLQKITILNPAPAIKTAKSILQNVDYLICNETELAVLTESKVIDTKEGIVDAARQLQREGPQTVIVTLGENGAVAIQENNVISIAGIQVKAIDATAAGDCFVGAFAASLASGMELKAAMEFANKAAALSVQKMGASSSLPTLDEVSRL